VSVALTGLAAGIYRRSRRCSRAGVVLGVADMKEGFEKIGNKIEQLGQQSEEAEAVLIGLAVRSVIANSLFWRANFSLSLQAAVNLLW
jgi:predicted phage-related endonuclease